MFKKFIHYSVIGATGTFLQFIILTLLVELSSLSAIIASDIGMVIGTVVNYFLTRRYVFNSDVAHYQGLIKFFSVSLVGIFFNSIIMHAFLVYTAFSYLFAQLLTAGIVALWYFLANNYWTFNPNIKNQASLTTPDLAK